MDELAEPNTRSDDAMADPAGELLEAVSADGVANKNDLLLLIESFIEQNKLGRGCRLPNERELAVAAGLSRSSVRYALDRLVLDGVLSRHVGRGTFIVGAVASRLEPADAMTPAEILEFRIAVEPSMIGLIVMKATDRQLARVRDFVAEGRGARTWQDCEHFDSTFHGMLFDLTGNSLFAKCRALVALARRNNAWTKYKELNFSAEKWIEYQHDHERIISGLLNRDLKATEASLRNHLIGVRANFVPVH